MQEFSNVKTDFLPLVDYLGLYFQIRDDYINLQSKEYMANKSFCEDLTEGKFSFPIIHSISSNGDTKLLKILKQKTEDYDLKKYALSLMEKTGSFEYTKNVLKDYREKIMKEITRLGGHQGLEAVMAYLEKDSK